MKIDIHHYFHVLYYLLSLLFLLLLRLLPPPLLIPLLSPYSLTSIYSPILPYSSLFPLLSSFSSLFPLLSSFSSSLFNFHRKGESPFYLSIKVRVSKSRYTINI